MQCLKCLILSNHNNLFPFRVLLHVGVSPLVIIVKYGKENNLRKEKEKTKKY